MARKNILNAGDVNLHGVEDTSGARSKTSQTTPSSGPKDSQISRSSQVQSTCVARLQPTSPRSYAKRKVRTLPTNNSLASQSIVAFATLSSTGTPTKHDGGAAIRSRATPARCAKRQIASYKDMFPADSDSSAASDHEISIFHDESVSSLTDSESNDDTSDLDLPIAWPTKQLLAMSPGKKKGASTQKGIVGLSDQENLRPKYSIGTFRLPDLTLNPKRPSVDSRGILKTPPSSPTKSRLNSPSKKARLPTPPGRPSLDNFWDAEEINTWNDTHSPRKALPTPSKRLQNALFPSKLLLQEPGTPSKSPSRTSPVRNQLLSPRKTKAEVAARRTFDDSKDALATAFLAELDDRITGGEVGRCTASTGGVRIVWSKTLNSTAGRASWRRETVRKVSKATSGSGSTSASTSTNASREPTPDSITPNSSSSSSNAEDSAVPPQAPSIIVRHHATIELASKVLTTEHRLYNTLAHEFCHLATYIVSGVRDRPHGAEFKSWGRKCDAAFGNEKGVKVTTKHGYKIEWKYLWACSGRDDGGLRVSEERDGAGVEEEEVVLGDGDDAAAGLVYDGGCGTTYGRHSKSIDVDRSRCGKCRGRLVQIRPVPRMGTVFAEANAVDSLEGAKTPGGKKGKKEPTGFAAFVKCEFALVKKEMGAGVKHGAVMEELGRRWRAKKETAATAAAPVADAVVEEDLVEKMKVIVIDD